MAERDGTDEVDIRQAIHSVTWGSQMKKNRKPRLTADGLPIDGREWVAADWSDLFHAMERAKKLIRGRHADGRTTGTTRRPPDSQDGR